MISHFLSVRGSALIVLTKYVSLAYSEKFDVAWKSFSFRKMVETANLQLQVTFLLSFLVLSRRAQKIVSFMECGLRLDLF